MRFFLLFLVVAALCRTGSAASNDQILVLIGLDGFRWDYLDKYRPPNLERLAGNGVRAERMIPSFPSVTFPNFYTLVTGLRPEDHGIVANSMYDPTLKETFTLRNGGPAQGKWWTGEPIWVTAEKQGVKSACMFWPGSEAEIGGKRPSKWLPYDQKFPMQKRVGTVLDWLSLPPAERPRLITLYFHEVDTAGHKYGPDSPEVAAAVREVDLAIGALVEGIDRLGLKKAVNLAVVSDRGMTEVSPDRVVVIEEMVKPTSAQVDFYGPISGLRPLEGTAEELFQTLAAEQKHFKVYRREEVPERFHFRANARIPPVIMVADPGWMIVKKPPLGELRDTFYKGMHGYDPAVPEMGATFLASGPAFKTGATLASFENVEVYDLLCDLLEITPAKNRGTGELAKRIMRQ